MKHGNRKKGFTLIELLVAVAITVVLVALMVTVTSGTLNLWRRAQDNFTASTEAALVLDAIERDVQAAIFREDGETWLAVDIIDAPAALTSHGWLAAARMKPSGGESRRLLPPTDDGVEPAIVDARFGLSGAWLRLVTTNVEARDTTRPGGSLPVAVSYQLGRRPISGQVSAANRADVRYTLFRSAVTAANTLSAGYDVTASDYGSSSTTPPGTRTTRSLTNPSTVADAIASNVVDFGVWLYARNDAGGLTRIFPVGESNSSYRARSRAAFPAVADVMVRFLTERGAVLIAGIERNDGSVTRPAAYATDAEWWWAEVEANSHVVARRIEVKGTAR